MNDQNDVKQTGEGSLEYERGRQVFRRAFLFFFILFCLIGGFWFGYKYGQRETAQKTTEERLSPSAAVILNKEARDTTIDFSLFWKVWGILKDKYVDKSSLDAKEMFYGAIDGMLAATGDPYTTFFSPKENKEFQEDISGTFEGIGAEMGIKNDILTIVAPLDGTPSEKAGLLAGDRIIKINGENTTLMSIEEAVSKIRGPKGTEVTLTIFRNGDQEAREISVRRDVILVKSVRFEMKDNRVAYIRISRFGDDTEREFFEAVKELRNKKAEKLVVDLRNNPGGFLEGAVTLGSAMLPSGTVVVIEEDGTGKRKETKARGGDVLSKLPTVVLINEGSASASEILSGALRDNRENVTLVGKKSFGKGSVQELIPVSKDMSVKITVARWLTPKGNQINNTGITPDVEVGLTADDAEKERDPQLEKALEILQTK